MRDPECIRDSKERVSRAELPEWKVDVNAHLDEANKQVKEAAQASFCQRSCETTEALYSG
eukprot:8590842-Pyramimonas_sp.AAC.1